MVMPPLPSPINVRAPDENGSYFDVYTESQMRKYGRACRAMALEEALLITKKYRDLPGGYSALQIEELMK